uniref:Uncharacterized protein n=1 Tax=Physcomitrium patens TaxID=3218 RepID=A0A2K1IM32_PHYPA|nr:hypothetical protein PHYPA_026653 [Physcomitrium patens]
MMSDGTMARDAFFKCLEADFEHLTSTDTDSVKLLYPSRCKPARAFLEQNCRRPWVKHFDRRFYAKRRVKHPVDTGDKQHYLRIKLICNPGDTKAANAY